MSETNLDTERLRERIDDLEHELAELRETLTGPLPLLWDLGLTCRESRMLATIYQSSGAATRNAIHLSMYEHGQADTLIKIVDVSISSLRRKLKPHGIEIETIHGMGYRLDIESRGLLRRMIADKPRQHTSLLRNRRAAS